MAAQRGQTGREIQMGRMKPPRPVVLALVLVVALAAGGGFVIHQSSSAPPVPDAVQITVTEVRPPSGGSSVTFDASFSGSVAAKVYTQLVSGTAIPPNTPQSCYPFSSTAPYLHYELDFFHSGVQTAVATDDAQGCQTLIMRYASGDTRYFSWLSPSGVSFWQVLHQLVGAPEPI